MLVELLGSPSEEQPRDRYQRKSGAQSHIHCAVVETGRYNVVDDYDVGWNIMSQSPVDSVNGCKLLYRQPNVRKMRLVHGRSLFDQAADVNWWKNTAEYAEHPVIVVRVTPFLRWRRRDKSGGTEPFLG